MPDTQKVVQVPGIGNIAFPGTMSDGQITLAINTHLEKQQLDKGPTQFEQQNAPSTAGQLARGAAMGVASSVIPEDQQSQDWKQNLSTIGKGLNTQVNTAATTPWGQGGPIWGVLSMLGKGFMNAAHGTASGVQEVGSGVMNKDPEQAAHGAGAAGGNFLQLEGMKGTPDAINDPLSREALQNISNVGSSKAAFIDRQVGEAAAVQAQVKPALDALHADGKQLMANVSSHIDALKPEGVFDKADVAGAVKDAMGVIKDPSKVPASLQNLSEAEAAPKAKGPMVGGVAVDPASPNYAKMKAAGAFTPAEIQAAEGTTGGEKMSFEALKQIHSDIGRQVAQMEGKGVVEAGVKAAYAKIGEMLNKEAESHGMLDQWQEGRNKVKMFNNIAYRSPLSDTYSGENHGQIMKPLISDDTGPQVKPLLEAISPYGIDTDKLNKSIGRYKYGETWDRMNVPSKMQLAMAAFSPKMGAIRTIVPRAMRSKFMTDMTMGKGLDPVTPVAPSKVYPSKLAAAQELKGNPTPFGGQE